jgi:hypothetical protein
MHSAEHIRKNAGTLSARELVRKALRLKAPFRADSKFKIPEAKHARPTVPRFTLDENR